MKALLIFGSFGALIALLLFVERAVGERARSFYDRNERWAFPTMFWALLAIGLVLPLFVGVVQEELFVLVGIFALMALGLNVVVGFAGLLDLGYVAFWAIGAYSWAILSGAGPIDITIPFLRDASIWLVLPIAVLITAISGLILGAPTLRLRGDYLALVTLGFGEIVRIVAENLEGVTRGSKGIIGIPGATVPFTEQVNDVIGGFNRLPFPNIPKITDSQFGVDPAPYYILTVIFLALMVWLIRRLNNSRVGRYWAAIREDELAAEAMGVPTLRYKLAAFAIGASTSGFAGVVYAARVGFISPQSFHFLISITILAMVVLGGLGSIAGSIVGAAILTIFPEVLRSLPDAFQESRFLIFGGAMVVMMIFRPQGFIPSRRRTAELHGEVTEDAVTVAPGEAPTGQGAPRDVGP